MQKKNKSNVSTNHFSLPHFEWYSIDLMIIFEHFSRLFGNSLLGHEYWNWTSTLKYNKLQNQKYSFYYHLSRNTWVSSSNIFSEKNLGLRTSMGTKKQTTIVNNIFRVDSIVRKRGWKKPAGFTKATEKQRKILTQQLPAKCTSNYLKIGHYQSTLTVKKQRKIIEL